MKKEKKIERIEFRTSVSVKEEARSYPYTYEEIFLLGLQCIRDEDTYQLVNIGELEQEVQDLQSKLTDYEVLKHKLSVKEEDIINVFPKDLNYLDSNKEKFNKCFISYDHENRDIGHQIKRELEKYSISCFLAHEDIECSQEWQNRILEELKGTDLFIPILSEEFNKSYFCSQEVGIAVFRNILIVPVSLDRTIPEGFLKKIQSKKLNQSNINIVDILMESSPKIMINH